MIAWDNNCVLFKLHWISGYIKTKCTSRAKQHIRFQAIFEIKLLGHNSKLTGANGLRLGTWDPFIGSKEGSPPAFLDVGRRVFRLFFAFSKWDSNTSPQGEIWSRANSPSQTTHEVRWGRSLRADDFRFSTSDARGIILTRHSEQSRLIMHLNK